ncbi:MAG: hypothetical protein AAF985_13865 [Bacteroidota bacterium]
MPPTAPIPFLRLSFKSCIMYKQIVIPLFLLFSLSLGLMAQTPLQTGNQSKAKAQVKEIPNFFYMEDVLLGGMHYLLTCQEVESGGNTAFKFTLSKGDKKQSFIMIDIKPAHQSSSIFQADLLNAFDQLNSSKHRLIPKEDSLKLLQINTDLTTTNPNPTFEDQNFINQLINTTALKYNFNSRVFENYFSPIISQLRSVNNTAYLEELQRKIISATVISSSQKEETKKQLRLASTGYLFQAYVKSIEASDLAPEVGTLYASKKVKLHVNSDDIQSQLAKLRSKHSSVKNDTKQAQKTKELDEQIKSLEAVIEVSNADSLIIDKVEVEVEYEQIANVKVSAICIRKDKGNLKLIFQNRIPIAYSTKADVSRDRGAKRARPIRLFETKNTFSKPVFIYMDDTFINDYRLLNKTENYSPKDQVLTIRPGEKGKVIKKEKVTNILKAKIFSDVVGLNNSQPNGIIQTEVSHRFYFNTRAQQFGDSYSYWGGLNSAMPKITLSKIEDNNKVLQLETHQVGDSSQDSVRFYVNTIDLFRHASWTSGGEVNLIYFGFPFLQSMVYLNFGTYVRYVPMRQPELADSIKFQAFQDIELDEDRRFGTNVIALFPEITWSISPHSRFRISYSAKYFRLFHLTDDFALVSNRKKFFNNQKDNDPWLLNFKFLAALRFNDDANGELFFRSYFTFLPNSASQNFFQAQIGYAFNIFDRPNNPAPPKPLEEL